jgi:succinoglycan biosynthesis transport protein ExoP
MAVSVMKTTEDEPTIHLTEYYHLLIRHKWIIIVSLAVMIGLALRYNSRLVPIYRATATLIIDKVRTQSPITGQRVDYETYLSESLTFNTHFELITSRPVLEQVIRDLKLDQVDKTQDELIEINPVRQFLSRFKQNIILLLNRKKDLPEPVDPRTGLVQALKGMVSIENIEDTRLLKINASSPSPTKARDIANGLAKSYINFNINNRMKSSQDTLSWLTDRMYEMKKRLEDAEEEFLAYKQSVKLISVEGKQNIISQKITEFNDVYLQARNKRLELDTKLEKLERISKLGKDIPLLRSLIGNKLINSLHSQLVDAELELSSLSKTYKSKHPKIVQINSHIYQTRLKLNQEIEKELDNLKAEQAVLLSREKVLQKTITDFEEEGMENNKKELQHTILKRNMQMNQNLYDALLVRLKEADITGNIDVSNIRITEQAQLPMFPISPNKKRNLLLGVILGLMIGIGISFLWEYLDRSLRTEEDVRKYLGLPVLSVIPIAEKEKLKNYGQSSDSPKQKTKFDKFREIFRF